jgi:hypothetical protein
MSRRSGQNGRIEQHGKVWTVRFWLDVEGQHERDYKRVKICPVNGPGSLNKSERKRRAQEIIAEFGANSEEVFRKAEAMNLGTTFKEQAERWFKEVQTRKRRPIKPRTADAWATYLSYTRSLILGVIQHPPMSFPAVPDGYFTRTAYLRALRGTVTCVLGENGTS